jgi:hypothetical protein
VRCLKCPQDARVHLSLTEKVHVGLCLFHAHSWETSPAYEMGRALALAGQRGAALNFWSRWAAGRAA